MSNKNKKYEYNSIKIDTLINEYQTGVLQIPRIQRKLVWKQDQKQKLQDSLMNGYPVGVILFSNTNSQKYIIDGLQRTTTIMGIFNNMFENMKPKILKDIISKTIKFLNKEYPQYSKVIDKSDFKLLEAKITENIRIKIESTNPRDSDSFAKSFCQKHINSIQDINKGFDSLFIEAILKNIHKTASEELGINEYSLPYIMFDGTVEETAHLFELINKQGTKLENSDIWRSKWSTIEMNFHDQQITNKINQSFDSILNDSSGIKHEKVDVLSPFDVIWYIFEELFSKNWNHHISKVFSGKKNNKLNESDKIITGLASLINLIKLDILLSLSNDQRFSKKDLDFEDSEIGPKFRDLIKSKEDVDQIIERLTRTVKIFDIIFNSFSFYKGNKKTNNSSTFLPEKTYSIVILGNIYKFIYANQISDENFVKQYQDLFIKHYIYDLLSGTFGSSSSKKAFVSISEGHYLNPLPEGALERRIEDFYDNSLKKARKNTFDNKACTLMAYLFMQDINISENDKQSFHNDHLIPKSKLEESGIETGVASFANLSLISDTENHQKSASIDMKHIYSDKIYKWAQNNREDLAEKFEKSYQSIVDSGLNEENYLAFLVARKNIIIKMYLEK